METVLHILQWLLPVGAFGSALGWLLSKKLRKAKETKGVHDAYREMYEDVYPTIKQFQNEVLQLRKEISQLHGVISLAVRSAAYCTYYNKCPVRHELSKPGVFVFCDADGGQPADGDGGGSSGSDGTGGSVPADSEGDGVSVGGTG